MHTCLCCVAGLPKGAHVGHLKAAASMTFLQMCGAESEDVVYVTLPLYHMSASLLGVGGCIHLGEPGLSSSDLWMNRIEMR